MKQNKKGFTMVELMVVMLISSICLVLAGGILLSSNNTFAAGERMNNSKSVGDAVYHFVEQKIIYSTHLYIADESEKNKPLDRYAQAIHIKNGRVEYRRQKPPDAFYDYYGVPFYSGKQVSMTVVVVDSTHVALDVFVKSKEGELLYQTGSTLQLINMTLGKKRNLSVKLEQTAEVSKFTNPYLIFDAVDLDQPTFEDTALPIANTMYERVKAAVIRYRFGIEEEVRAANPSLTQQEITKKVKEIRKAEYGVDYDGISNDLIRSHVQKKYADSYSKWAAFPQDVVDHYIDFENVPSNSPKEFTIQPYYSPKQSLDKDHLEITIYATRKEESWNAYFIYDDENKVWYTTYATKQGAEAYIDGPYKLHSQGMTEMDTRRSKSELMAEIRKDWNPLS